MLDNIYKDFQGQAQSSAIKVTAAGVTLPEQAARFVMLSNWNAEDRANLTVKSDSGVSSEDSVFYGFGGVYAHELFPGATTILLPLTNLNQLALRCRTGKEITIWFSSFW